MEKSDDIGKDGCSRHESLPYTDSTHILAAVRTLNRLERVGETMRRALNLLAEVVPEWLRVHAAPEWYERYGRRMENYRFRHPLRPNGPNWEQ